MSLPLSGRAAELRALIWRFLSERLDSKLEKLPADDPKRTELQQQFVPATWLDDAARRVGQIQAVTHSLKPIHPDAKGSSLFCDPAGLPALAEVGSHNLGARFDIDVVGNAAALDVYKLLKLSHGGKGLLDLASARDADLCAALSDDPAQAEQWCDAFASLAKPRGKASSHTLAKQVYWLTGTDVHDDSHYQLLAPLYPTSLAHRVYQTLQDDRFSDAAKAARAAKKAGEPHERPVRDYPNLALQSLGGTKPQNISQLNSERRGDNALLASLPPVWVSVDIKPVLHARTLLDAYGRRPEVRRIARLLRDFLVADPARNIKTRQRRDGWIDDLIDELLQFTAELRSLPAGWTQSVDCDLPTAQRQWLDPDSAQSADEDAAEQVAEEFANWINKQLRPPLPVGDPEFLAWRKQALDAFKADEREAA